MKFRHNYAYINDELWNTYINAVDFFGQSNLDLQYGHISIAAYPKSRSMFMFTAFYSVSKYFQIFPFYWWMVMTRWKMDKSIFNIKSGKGLRSGFTIGAEHRSKSLLKQVLHNLTLKYHSEELFKPICFDTI
jgi:hypothetical protein